MINVRVEFFSKMRGKPFYKKLREWVVEDKTLGSVVLAKCLSSMLTHSLIEMEQSGKFVYSSLFINEQAQLLSKFLGGQVKDIEIKPFYKERYAQYLK